MACMLTAHELRKYALHGEGFLYSRLSLEAPMAAVITEQYRLPEIPRATTRQCRAILLNTDTEMLLKDTREYEILGTVRSAHTVPVSFRAMEALGYTVDPETWRVVDFLCASQLNRALHGYELLFLWSLAGYATAAFLINTGTDDIILAYGPRFWPHSRTRGLTTYLIKPAVRAKTLEEFLASIVLEARNTGLPPSEAAAAYGFILFDTSSFLYMLSNRTLAPNEIPPRQWSMTAYVPHEPFPWGRKYAVAVAFGRVAHSQDGKRILAYLPPSIECSDDQGSWYEVIPPNVRGIYGVMYQQPAGVFPLYPFVSLKE